MRGLGEFQLRQQIGKQKKYIEELEAKLVDAESTLSRYVFVEKKPDYYYSFSGFLIFRQWYINNGLHASQAELLIIISYIDVFLTSHFKLYTRNLTRVTVRNVLITLVEQHYVVKIKVHGKSKSSLRDGWVLTQRGKDLEADYERFYDEQTSAIKKGTLFSFNFEDGLYFRKKRLTRSEKVLLQNGGKLPGYNRKLFIEPEDLNKQWHETT